LISKKSFESQKVIKFHTGTNENIAIVFVFEASLSSLYIDPGPVLFFGTWTYGTFFMESIRNVPTPGSTIGEKKVSADLSTLLAVFHDVPKGKEPISMPQARSFVM